MAWQAFVSDKEIDSRTLFFAMCFIAANLTEPITVFISHHIHSNLCNLTFDKRSWVMPSEQTLKHGLGVQEIPNENSSSDPIA